MASDNQTPTDEASKLWKQRAAVQEKQERTRKYLTWPWLVVAAAVGIGLLLVGVWIVAFA